jgi:hypothetical protein
MNEDPSGSIKRDLLEQLIFESDGEALVIYLPRYN